MYLTNVDSNALQVALRKIRKNANVRSLAQTSTQFRSVTNSELHRRHVEYKVAQKNARQMYDNLRAHYEAVSSGEGYGSNNMGVADTLAYWTLTPSKHAVLLKRQIRYPNRNIPSMKIKNRNVFYENNSYARRMRKIRKYPAVYRKERNSAAKNYLRSSNSNNSNTNRHRRQPMVVN
jgi:hypothetical protein